MSNLKFLSAILAASCATAAPELHEKMKPPTPGDACIERFQEVRRDVDEILGMLPDDCLGANKRTSMANATFDAARGECEEQMEELQTGMAAATTKAKLLRLASKIEEACEPSLDE